MKKVLVATNVTEEGLSAIRKELTGLDVKLEQGSLPDSYSPLSALVVRSEKVTQNVIDRMPELEIIVRAGAGLDGIDVPYATTKNIFVENTPGANSNAVAELALMHMLIAYRHGIEAHVSTSQGQFEKKKYMGGEIQGRTLGIIGFGQIGMLLAQKASALGMKVQAHDPYVKDRVFAEHGVRYMPIEKCFDADVISLHMPYNNNTRGAIGYELISNVRHVLINTARAEIVDEPGLIKVMQENPHLIYAADLFHEGDKPGEKKIITLFPDRVQATPHIGASTFEANTNAFRQSGKQLAAYFRTGEVMHAANYDTIISNIRQPAHMSTSGLAYQK